VTKNPTPNVDCRKRLPKHVTAAAHALGLSGNGMAAALGVSKRTWRRWLAGQDVPHWVPVMVGKLMQAASECDHPGDVA
jgi:DNA-binding transcriptional regulator YiaG